MSDTTIISSADLAAAIKAATPAIPVGHTNALIGTIDQSGAQVLITAKLGQSDDWSVTGLARHDWSGDNTVGASVVYSW